MRNIRLIVSYFLLLSFVFPVDKAGTMAAKFLSASIGPKAVAMGGAFTAIANDGSAMYWNPAGIGYNRIRNIYVNHSDWIADISFDYFSAFLLQNHQHHLELHFHLQSFYLQKYMYC